MYDADGRYHYANKPFCDFVGHESLDNKSLFDVFPLQHATKYKLTLDQCFQLKESMEYIEDVYPDDGKHYRFLVHKFPVEHGAQWYVGGCAYDVTGYLEIEERHRLHSHILNNIHEAVIGADAKGIIFFWNKYAEQLYGWKKHEAIGQHVNLIVPENATYQNEAKEIMNSMMNGESWSGEFYVQTKAGKVFPVHVTDTPIFNSKGGRLEAIIGISFDITDKMKAANRMQAAIRKISYNNKVLNEIAFQQSHLVRRPLANILGIIPLLDMDGMSEQNKQMISMLQDSGAELDTVIKEIVMKTR